jgi:hypothetical protein
MDADSDSRPRSACRPARAGWNPKYADYRNCLEQVVEAWTRERK